MDFNKKGEERDKKLEIQKELEDSFKEYFGSDEAIYDNILELEKGIKEFLEWRNNNWIVPEKGKTPNQLWKENNKKDQKESDFKTPNLKKAFSENMAKFGFICDANYGVVIVPFYDYLKKLFEGSYKEIPDYPGFIYNIVTETNKFIPSFIIKKFIRRNPKRTLELFKDAYKEIDDLDDVYDLLSYYREDWEEDFDLSIELYDPDK